MFRNGRHGSRQRRRAATSRPWLLCARASFSQPDQISNHRTQRKGQGRSRASGAKAEILSDKAILSGYSYFPLRLGVPEHKCWISTFSVSPATMSKLTR